MIVDRRSKSNPKDRETYAACDGCEAPCEESRCPGEGARKAADKAHAKAVASGWAEVTKPERGSPRRKTIWTVKLLCPACAAKEPAAEKKETPA